MKKTNKLNVPATVYHMIGDTQYRVGCNITAIDESKETCTLKFANGRVESGVPIKDVYINEAFLDTVRKYGKKFGAWLVKKAKGLMCILTGDGTEDANSFFTPVNIAIKQAQGELPTAVKFFPSDNIIAQAEAAGFTVEGGDDDEILAEETMKEKKQIETFWRRVQRHLGTTDDTVSESIDFVVKEYYKKNQLPPKAVNEAGIGSFDPIANKLGWSDLDGMSVNTEGLKSFLVSNIDEQLNLSRTAQVDILNTSAEEDLDPGLADFLNQFSEEETKAIADGDYKTPVPLIWGAPGIGKTQIIGQVLKQYKKNPTTPRNMYLYTVSCAGLDADSFRLPDKTAAEDGIVDATFEQGVLSWLPMYTPRDAQYNQMMEDRFARCQHISKGTDGDGLLDSEGDQYQGGVLFLDEVVRVNRNAIPVIMNICDRQLQEKRLAKSWAIVCAANRYSDDPTQEATEFMEATPIMQRFVHVTYKPERAEWLKWARSTNQIGVQNIEPEICDFIEAMPEYIWYRLIDNGGYDEAIKQMAVATGNKKFQTNAGDFYANGMDIENWEMLKDAAEEGASPIALSKSTWNGRTWHRISNAYRNMLTFVLLQNPLKYTYPALVGRSIKEFDYHGVDSSLMEEALDHVPAERWKLFCNQYIEPNEREAAIEAAKQSGFKKMGWIRNALIRIVREHSGADEPDTTKKLQSYFDWQSMFAERDVIHDIYNFGELRSAKYKEIDNLGTSRNGGFNWKDNDAVVRQVEKFILSQYPDGTTAASGDFSKYADLVTPGLTSLVGKFTTLATRSYTADVEKKVVSLIEGSFALKHKLDKKDFDELFTVHTHTKKYGDLKILPEVHDVIATVIYNVVKESKFIFYMLNFVKYCIKIDFTRDNYAPIGSYQEADNFKNMVIKGLSLGQETVSEYTAIHNAITQISTGNSVQSGTQAAGHNKIIGDLKYLDAFMFFKGLLLTAFNKKTLTRMSGNVSGKK